MSVKEKKKIHVNFCTIPATKTTRERQQKQVKRQYHKDGTNKRTSLNKNKKNKKEKLFNCFFFWWSAAGFFLQKNESKIDLCNFGVCMRMCGVFWSFVLGTFYVLTVIKFYVLCFIMFFLLFILYFTFFSLCFRLTPPTPVYTLC